MNRSSLKKLFLKFSQYSQENTCVGVSFLITIQVVSAATLLKNGIRHRCFHVNIAKLLRTSVFKNISERLLERFPT